MDWKTITLEELKEVINNRISYHYGEKPPSDDYCGCYFHGRNTPFTLEEHEIPIRSFKAFSRYSYPLFLFYNEKSGGDIDVILSKYDNIVIVPIDHFPDIKSYDKYVINKMFREIPSKYQNTVTFHSDGFFLNSGWEDFLEANDFDYVGAPWCNLPDSRLLLDYAKEKYPVENLIGIGNGGFCYRKRDKCLRVVDAVDSRDLNWDSCPDDLFFSYFGFGLGIFKPVDVDSAFRWSREPFLDFSSFGFHKTYRNMCDIIEKLLC